MAITIDVRTDHIFELEEFIAHVQRNVDVDDQSSLRDAATSLLALANNRHFIRDKLNQELADWRDFQPANGYTAQTLILGRGRGFAVRANIWTPQTDETNTRTDSIYFYSLAHDHNFDFLTVGYYGSGYETDLYEYDRSEVAGLTGEPVALIERGRTSLPQGKVMFYRAARDIHAQHPPKDFSISINLMAAGKRVGLTEQFFFDVENRRISAPVETGLANRVFLCEAARYLADARTCGLLERLADIHPCGRTRAAAIESLASIEPASSERLWTRAADDPNVYLRTVARGVLRRASRQSA